MDIATRISKTHEAIQAEALVELLHDQAFGKAKLGHTELRAIECLLRKSLPDLGPEAVPDPQGSSFTVVISEPMPPPDPRATPAARDAPERSLPRPTQT